MPTPSCPSRIQVAPPVAGRWRSRSFQRILILLLAILVPAGIATAALPDPRVLPLWEGTPPNPQPIRPAEEPTQADPSGWIRHVPTPSIEVRLASRENATGQAVVVCPGGGYGGLAYSWEGTDIAEWLNHRGIAAILLRYRLPVDGDAPHQKWLCPLLDAQRAIRVARAHAAAWGIHPAKVGIMGFSAGGHLASTAGTRFDGGDPSAADPIDRLSSRPDFLVLVYPVITMTELTHAGSRENLLGPHPSETLIRRYSSELQVTARTPPTFLVHAGDDQVVPVQNSLLFYQALLAHKVPAELHLYPRGGHGFSLALDQGRLQDWATCCAHWLAELAQP